MVYTKMSSLRNAGDKSIGEVWLLLCDLLIRLKYVLGSCSESTKWCLIDLTVPLLQPKLRI